MTALDRVTQSAVHVSCWSVRLSWLYAASCVIDWSLRFGLGAWLVTVKRLLKESGCGVWSCAIRSWVELEVALTMGLWGHQLEYLIKVLRLICTRNTSFQLVHLCFELLLAYNIQVCEFLQFLSGQRINPLVFKVKLGSDHMELLSFLSIKWGFVCLGLIESQSTIFPILQENVVIFAHLLYLVLERLGLPRLIILVRVVELVTETRIIDAELQTDSFELLLAPIFLLFVAHQVLSQRFEILSVSLLCLLVESVQV